MGNMKFRGLSTKDLDLVIQFKPDYPFPAKDVTVEHIPGRNGDLYIDNESWQNVQRTYSIVSVFRPGTDFVSNSEKLIKWLTQKSGYFRLEDDYDPHVYRMAAYKGSGSLPNLYDEATVLSVTFDCKPQRYLKSGEKEITFEDVSKAILENPTGYNALPDIKIAGINNPVQDDVLLVTVGTTTDKENFDKVTSIIALSDIPSDVHSITIVSEEQTCYSNQNGNINGSINLNGTQFPVLEDGVSLISIDKYKEKINEIDPYNDKIKDAQEMLQCKYLPFDAQVKTKEKSTTIKSWNLLKQQVEEIYDASSYASYCMEKADEFTFNSYNNLLQSNGVAYTVRPKTDYDQENVGQDGYAPIKEAPWLKLKKNNDGTYTLAVGDITELIDSGQNPDLSNYCGYFYTNSGYITLKFQDNVLQDGLKDSASLQIIFYPANSSYEIAVDYNNPDWVKMEVAYEDDANSHYIKSVSFVTLKTGYYYLPKAGLFGSASWNKLSPNTVLTTLNWSTYYKAFMPSGISVSKTATFTYNFLPYPYHGVIGDEDYQEFLQYEPIMKDKVDKDGKPEVDGNGNKIQEVKNPVYFKIISVDDNITKATIVSTENMYCRINDEKLNEHKKLSKYVGTSSTSNIIVSEYDTKKRLMLYCIKYTLSDVGSIASIPSYEAIDNWPEYLDGTPRKNNAYQVQIDINPAEGAIDFKVNIKGWYRVKYTVKNGDKTEEVNSPWLLLNQNGLIFTSTPVAKYPSDGDWPPNNFNMAADQNIVVDYLKALEDSDDFPIAEYIYHGVDKDGNEVDVPDIAFFDKDGNKLNSLPTWINIIVNPGTDENHLDATLIFNVGEGATNKSLFKWDTRSIWTSKSKVEEGHLTDSARTDDTTIYYLNKLPACLSNQDVSHPEISTSDKFKAIVLQNSATGDPESIEFYPIVNGYYRASNNTNWKWIDPNTVIYTAKNSEKTTIYDLKLAEQQDEFEITIIPRWWSL